MISNLITVCRCGFVDSAEPAIRMKNWIRKNRKMLMPYGLRSRAFLKSNLTIAEKLLERPVLIVSSKVINSEADGTGWALSPPKIREYANIARMIPAKIKLITR